MIRERAAEFDALRPRQLTGIECVLCGRHLGPRARPAGVVRHPRWGYSYQLWACAPACPARSLEPGVRR